MAAATLLTLLDDITSILDDVAGMTKVAAGKTAGVVGDDLALNAKQVMGTPAERELPVVWSVAKGSLINKAILVPAAIILSAFLPFLVMPLLMLGGLFLCYEGAEKILHHHVPHDPATHDETEKDKIKGAIRTDFILSAEIIIIALGIVAAEPLMTRILTLTAVGLGMTVFVYGLVAGIVKLDDAGLYLSTKSGGAKLLGRAIIFTTPYLMRALGFLGTAAMFVVGGQIVLHGIPSLHHAFEDMLHLLPAWLHGMAGFILGGLFGLFCGMIIVKVIEFFTSLRQKFLSQKNS